jgi:8-oxo-dGTP diphosphatase
MFLATRTAPKYITKCIRTCCHPKEQNFFDQRFISIGYYALVDFFNVNPTPDDFSEICTWRDLNDLPKFQLDHKLIFETALDTLRLQLNYQPIGYNLMPKEFTMPELQKAL